MNEADRSWPSSLVKRLPDALRQAAVEPALDDEGIDHSADVVDGVIRNELDCARFRIDLELADVRSIGEREVRRIVERALVQARFEGLEREAVRDVCRARHLVEAHGAVGARDLEPACLELDVAGRRLQEVRRDVPALFRDLFGRLVKRGAAHRDGARAERPGAHRHRGGVVHRRVLRPGRDRRDALVAVPQRMDVGALERLDQRRIAAHQLLSTDAEPGPLTTMYNIAPISARFFRKWLIWLTRCAGSYSQNRCAMPVAITT